MIYETYSRGELYHHGILGQKWGVRRFQNKDGSLTAKGKDRYSDDRRGDDTEEKSKKGLTDKQKKLIKVGVAVVATGLVAYGGYSLYKKINVPVNQIGDKNFAELTDEIKDLSEVGSTRLDSVMSTIGDQALHFEGGQEGYTAAKAAFSEHTKEWASKLTNSELDAIKEYTGHSFGEINALLRGGGDSSNNVYGIMANECRKALDKASFPEDTWVTRGSDLRSIMGLAGWSDDMFDKNVTKLLDNDGKFSDEAVGVLKKTFVDGGAVLKEKGFMSTSARAGSSVAAFANSRVKYTILVPKGSKAAYIDPISLHTGQSENEVLLQAGSKFMMNDIFKDEDGGLNVVIKMLLES